MKFLYLHFPSTMDIVGASLHAKEILVDITDSVKESTREPSSNSSKTIAYGPDGQLLTDDDIDDLDPAHGMLDKWGWARVYYDAFMTVALPTFDVLTDWASILSIATSGQGGLFGNDCQLLSQLGSLWSVLLATLLAATILGTIMWLVGLYLFVQRWPRDKPDMSFRDKLRTALESFAKEQSTRFLCRKQGDKSRFRAAHCHQLATLLLEDLPSLIATLILFIVLGGSVVTIISFFVSVLSFSKHISSYFSLSVLCCSHVCCRSCACSRRIAVASRFICCSLFCVAVVAGFVTFPVIVLDTGDRTIAPQVIPVRSWSVRIPALGIDQRFVPPADSGDMRVLRCPGFALFGAANGSTEVRLDVSDQDAHIKPLYGGNVNTLPFDDALVLDMHKSLGNVFRDVYGSLAVVQLWRRKCSTSRMHYIAVALFFSNEQQCLIADWPEGCKMSSTPTRSIDFEYNVTSGAVHAHALLDNMIVTENEFLTEPACSVPCFADSPFCAGFGAHNRSQLAVADVEIQFGDVELLCLND
jgi:hypothetical protein